MQFLYCFLLKKERESLPKKKTFKLMHFFLSAKLMHYLYYFGLFELIISIGFAKCDTSKLRLNKNVFFLIETLQKKNTKFDRWFSLWRKTLVIVKDRSVSTDKGNWSMWWEKPLKRKENEEKERSLSLWRKTPDSKEKTLWGIGDLCQSISEQRREENRGEEDKLKTVSRWVLTGAVLVFIKPHRSYSRCILIEYMSGKPEKLSLVLMELKRSHNHRYFLVKQSL